MLTFAYNDEQLINVGDKIPIKLVKVKEKAMTAQEAIEELKSRRMCAAYVGSDYVDCVDINALDMAISALEKQIPKEPDYISDGYAPDGTDVWDAYCPNCGYELDEDRICPKCGQAIEWSD